MNGIIQYRILRLGTSTYFNVFEVNLCSCMLGSSFFFIELIYILLYGYTIFSLTIWQLIDTWSVSSFWQV